MSPGSFLLKSTIPAASIDVSGASRLATNSSEVLYFSSISLVTYLRGSPFLAMARSMAIRTSLDSIQIPFLCFRQKRERLLVNAKATDRRIHLRFECLLIYSLGGRGRDEAYQQTTDEEQHARTRHVDYS